jgi:protein-arginine kinase activator protein McsA
MIPRHVFFKFCKNCGERFKPISKHSKICDDCFFVARVVSVEDLLNFKFSNKFTKNYKIRKINSGGNTKWKIKTW